MLNRGQKNECNEAITMLIMLSTAPGQQNFISMMTEKPTSDLL